MLDTQRKITPNLSMQSLQMKSTNMGVPTGGAPWPMHGPCATTLDKLMNGIIFLLLQRTA